MMTELDTPYSDAFADYRAAGWNSVLPLPYRQKFPPPNGYTGAQAEVPSYPDCQAWADMTPDANVALRLPDGVVGLDVDDYGDKPGADTLAGLVRECGALPPTVKSTSRGDGVSGIMLYRVPEGTRLVTALPGLELIQHWHRYAVVWPSVHPSTGNRYQWLDERTGEAGHVPALDDLPALPAAWLTRLASDTVSPDKDRSIDVGPVVEAFPAGEPCHHVQKAAGRALTASGVSRHDAYNGAVLAVMRAGRRGCPGAQVTLRTMRDTFVAVIGDRAQKALALEEFGRMVAGGAQIVGQDDAGEFCVDDLSWIPDSVPAPEAKPEDDPEWNARLREEVARLRLRDEARAAYEALKAGEVEPLEPVNLASFLDEPSDDVRFRVDGLWPAGGRTLLVAQAKAGKTTLVGRNLLPCLVDGGRFLGEHDVEPVTGRVVYLNLEVGENVIRSWLRTAGIDRPDRVAVINLRGRVSRLQLGSPEGRQRFASVLRDLDAEVVILDPLAPLLAAHGLDENSNSDVASFYAWWSEALTLAGVRDDLIAHHAGHGTGRSRGASRLVDEPDSVWTIDTDRDEGVDQVTRTFHAYGRDVELYERVLTFDPSTGALGYDSRTKTEVRAAAQERTSKLIVLSRLKEAGQVGEALTMNAITRGLTGKDASRLKVALESLHAAGLIDRTFAGQSENFRLMNPNIDPESVV